MESNRYIEGEKETVYAGEFSEKIHLQDGRSCLKLGINNGDPSGTQVLLAIII